AALAASDTIATLLPGTAFFLGVPYAPARRLLDQGVAVALASDCNPGTCPSENLPLVGAMACTQMGMLPGEAVTALTLNAAAAPAVRCLSAFRKTRACAAIGGESEQRRLPTQSAKPLAD